MSRCAAPPPHLGLFAAQALIPPLQALATGVPTTTVPSGTFMPASSASGNGCLGYENTNQPPQIGG